MSRNCHPARRHRESTQARLPHPQLPYPIAPIASETLASYLQRLTDKNLLRPSWLSSLARQPEFLTAVTELTGLPQRNLISALPELRSAPLLRQFPYLLGQASDRAGKRHACTRCAAARTGIRAPSVIVFATHEDLICRDHSRWIGSPDLKCVPPQQFQLDSCPDIIAANIKHRELIARWGRGPALSAFNAAVTCLSIWARWPAVVEAPDIKRRWSRLGITEDSIPSDPREIAAWYPTALSIARIIVTARQQISMTPAGNADTIADAVTRVSAAIPGLRPAGAGDPFRRALVADALESDAETETSLRP